VAGLALGIPAGHALLRDRAESVLVAARAEPLLPSDPPQSRASALVEEGRRALRGGQVERALELAREAERLEPDNANIKNNVCAYLGKLRRFDEAVSACQGALELQPDFMLARNNLTWVRSERAKGGASSPRLRQP
jgi:Flp pilus assembly protein TadD